MPVLPSQSFIDLSNEAEAINRASGENCTQLINCLCPVIVAVKNYYNINKKKNHRFIESESNFWHEPMDFLSFSGVHRRNDQSSEPETSNSQPCRSIISLYLVVAIFIGSVSEISTAIGLFRLGIITGEGEGG